MDFVTLKEIAELSLCVSFRSRIDTNDNFDTKLIKMQDIDDYVINMDNLDKVEYKGNKDQYIQDGDILIKTRPPKIFASMVLNPNNENLISVAPMVRARITQDIPSYYLLWYFTSEKAQRYFNQQIQGTVLLSLPMNIFKDLEVPILSMEEMNSIANIFKKNQEYQLSLRELGQKRQKQINTILNQTIGAYNDTNRY